MIGAQTQKHHIDQLKKRHAHQERKEGETTVNDFDLFPSPSTTSTPATEENMNNRYPQRDHRPPDRLTY